MISMAKASFLLSPKYVTETVRSGENMFLLNSQTSDSTEKETAGLHNPPFLWFMQETF